MRKLASAAFSTRDHGGKPSVAPCGLRPLWLAVFPARRPPHARPRSGIMLVMALVILAVTVLMTTASVRTICSDWGQQRQAQWQLQADWLASAGLDRAAARLRGDRAYRGETWRTDGPPNPRGSRQPAAVEILVQPESPTRCRIAATAVYPAAGPFSAYATKSGLFQIAKLGD